MIISEQFVKIIMSALIAYSIGMWYANTCSDTYKLVHRTYTMGIMAEVCVAAYAVAVAVPCIYISSRRTVKLLQARD